MNVGFKIPTVADDNVQPVRRDFDIRKYLNFIWRHWMFIGAVTALSLLMGVIYLVRATPRYTATTQVLLERPQKSPTDTGADVYTYRDRSFLENQLAILKSDALLQRVVIKEGLATPAPAAKEPQNVDASADGPEEAAEEESPSTGDRSIADGINGLRGALSVSRSGQAEVFNISITSEDPAKAAKLANAVADAYVVDQLDARFESAKRSSSWLSDRLVDLRQQLRDSEEAVQKFRRDHGLARSGPTVALNDQQLSELNSKLIAARTDVAEKKTRADFLKEVAAGRKTLDSSLPDSLQSTAQATALATLRGKLADVSQREADLLARYSSRHPAVANVQAEKRDIERSIAAETQRMVEALKNDYTLAKARLDATEQAMREATGQGGLNNDDSVKLRELERTAAVNKSLFEDFLQKAKVSAEQSTFQARDVRVIMPAQKPGGPSYPDQRRALMMALLAGLGLGIAGAIALEMLSPGFTTPNQVEETLGVPVLASVRRMERSKLIKDGEVIPIPFYQLHFPLSPFSEAMRALRSGIHMSDVDQPPKVIHVTSSKPSEGKSTIAASLAISAATSGLKVALIDADLRHPSVSRFFNLEKEKGLVDLLLGAPSENLFRFQGDLKLAVLPSGSKSLNPTDLLGSERMKQLVARLKETFDYVIFDTPPVGPVIDPLIVANLADKTIFIIEWGSTDRELVTASIRQLSNYKRIGGVVLNSVKQERAKKYGGEYYYEKAYEKYYSE
jgi:succinoglycan biosynthesis transport protein ExoP